MINNYNKKTTIIIIITITLIETNVTYAESRPRLFHSTQKRQRKRREVDKRCAISKQSSHDTTDRWERNNVGNMGRGGTPPRMRIRPVAHQDADRTRDSPEKFCWLCWSKPLPGVCMSDLLSRFDHTGTE